jgi:hypothetical protein
MIGQTFQTYEEDPSLYNMTAGNFLNKTLFIHGVQVLLFREAGYQGCKDVEIVFLDDLMNPQLSEALPFID